MYLCLSPFPLWLTLALESEGKIISPVCLQELSGRVRVRARACVCLCGIRSGWERTHREKENVFDIRSAHTVGEAGTAGYD